MGVIDAVDATGGVGRWYAGGIGMLERKANGRIRAVTCALLASALLGACSAEREATRAPTIVEPATPALRWKRDADELHALAQGAKTEEARAHAIREIGAFADRAPPNGVTVQEATETRQRLYARAAQLALDANAPDRALRLATRGLRAPGEGPSRTQLLNVVARAKRALGDEAGAIEAERAALGEDTQPSAPTP